MAPTPEKRKGSPAGTPSKRQQLQARVGASPSTSTSRIAARLSKLSSPRVLDGVIDAPTHFVRDVKTG